jgi:hypothetical protein
MLIVDRGLKLEIEDEDPRAAKIRALLLGETPDAGAEVERLWRECTAKHRAILVAIAAAGEVSQIDLEAQLDDLKDAYELRGRLAGIARVAKRLGVAYPIRNIGAHRETRRFTMEERAQKRVVQLSNATK